jgi:hypothetical protein
MKSIASSRVFADTWRWFRPALPADEADGVAPFGAGGSAMPCGLVLPAASAKLAAGDWLPEVRDAAAVN